MLTGIIIGAVSAWIIFAVFASIANGFSSSGVEIYDGWGGYILLAPIYIPFALIVRPIYNIIKKSKKKNNKKEN